MVQDPAAFRTFCRSLLAIESLAVLDTPHPALRSLANRNIPIVAFIARHPLLLRGEIAGAAGNNCDDER